MKRLITLSLMLAGVATAALAQTDGQTTPYIFPDFTEATVLQKGGASLQAPLNYNLLTQEICFVQNKQIMVMDNAAVIDTIYFTTRKFIPVGNVYYEKLTDTPISLWVQNKGKAVAKAKNANVQNQQNNVATSTYGFKREKLGVQSATYNQQLPDYQAVQLENVYYLQKDGKFNAIENVKKLQKIFPGKEAQIEAFVKDNNIRFRETPDLIKLVTFANK